jgi:hypothetical protein
MSSDLEAFFGTLFGKPRRWRIILKSILRKYGVGVWTAFI